MAKIALISDIHFGVRGDSDLFFNNTLKFLHDEFFPRLLGSGIKEVFILGDIWDKRKIINIHTLHRTLSEFFDRLHILGIKTYIIYGNHDTYFKNTNEVNSISGILGRYDNIQIIPKYEVIELYGMKIGMVSWINPSNREEKLQWIANCNADVLMGHFEIQNMNLPDGLVYEHGVDKNIFSRFEYVISGHYHTKTFDGKIYYLGSPVEFTWGDYGVKKGFTLFNTVDRSFEFVPNPYTIHEKITYDEKSINVLTFPYERYAGKIVTVYIPSYFRINTNQFNIFLDSLSVQCYSLDTREVDSEFADLSVVSTVEGMSDTKTLISSYVDTVFSETTNLDPEELKSYVFSLHKTALSMSGSLL
jgi:DNA repair exonuclease SbcCD nuclease subunit